MISFARFWFLWPLGMWLQFVLVLFTSIVLSSLHVVGLHNVTLLELSVATWFILDNEIWTHLMWVRSEQEALRPGARCAAVDRVTKSWMQLTNWTTTNGSLFPPFPCYHQPVCSRQWSQVHGKGKHDGTDLSSSSWTVARQARLSIGFSRQEYWSG